MTNPHRKVGVFCLVVIGIGTDGFCLEIRITLVVQNPDKI
jgi:hypothetical protein